MILLLLSCDKDPGGVQVKPVAFFRIQPDSGNTTTIFEFNADSATRQGSREAPVFVRWDWQRDGVWDAQYTTKPQITHRFYQAGTYRVRLEAVNLAGLKDTFEIQVFIRQGYSPPRALFRMTPDSANIKNEFLFDASGSKDDEDSLDQLEFRWDFEGDGIWDTDYTKNPNTSRRFSEDKIYPVKLMVRDPQKMVGSITQNLKVTRLNDQINPSFTIKSWPSTIQDTVYLNAGASSYSGDPEKKLLFSWDTDCYGIWTVEHLESPNYQYVSRKVGINRIKLRVTDPEGLYMEKIDSFEVFPLNSPPVISLVVGNPVGNTHTSFYMHVKNSRDREDSYSQLFPQWDVNNDGKWDAEYDGLYEITITKALPGKYPVKARITDSKAKISETTDTLLVTSGSHETGILEDRRAQGLPDYYGTVKIGNQWWMQSNLRYEPLVEPGYGWFVQYYMLDRRNFAKYGGLYSNGSLNGKPTACPRNWHVPSLAEWETLMKDLGADSDIKDLMFGGSSEMHILLSGSYDGRGHYIGLGEYTNFWTTDLSTSGQAKVWYIDPSKGLSKSVLVGRNYWLPVRCVRDN